MPGAVFLEGDSINLRTVEKEDIEFLRDGINHPKVRIHLGHRIPVNLESQEEFFQEVISNEDEIHLLICRNGERTGIVSLRPEEDDADKIANIGIWIHPEYHGNGYATESIDLITSYGFNQLNLHKIYARAHQDNDASKRVWEKLGFACEGTLREHVYIEGEYKDLHYYGLLKGEWQ